MNFMWRCAVFVSFLCKVLPKTILLIARGSLPLILVILSADLFSQDANIKVNGHFNNDSTQVGKPIYFSLTAQYPSQRTLLFPDSTFSFTPFEWISKTYAVTKTRNGISYDSVTYKLTTYEIDSVQYLKLPVFIVQKKDCTQIFSNVDTLFIKHLVSKASIPDSLSIEKLPLKVNTSYLPVGWQLNYVIAGIVGGAVLFLIILVWILFGKRIKRHFALKRLNKSYASFLEKYDLAVDRLNTKFTPTAAEETLVLWKKYMESLVSRPYTKFTSREIREIEKNESLGKALSSIDRMIYANLYDSTSAFYNLKDHVYQEFEKKKNELMHG